MMSQVLSPNEDPTIKKNNKSFFNYFSSSLYFLLLREICNKILKGMYPTAIITPLIKRYNVLDSNIYFSVLLITFDKSKIAIKNTISLRPILFKKTSSVKKSSRLALAWLSNGRCLTQNYCSLSTSPSRLKTQPDSDLSR